MSNEKVIEAFLEHKKAHTPTREIGVYYNIYTYKGQTLNSTGEVLINYDTKIAYWKNDTVYLNTKKYSVTTTKIQGKIRFLAHQKNIKVIEYIGE